MHVALSLLLAALLVPLHAAAQAPAAPPRGAESRRGELERAFEALKAAPDEAAARIVEHRIRQLWAQAASPAAALLLRRGMRNIEANLPAEALEDLDAALVLDPGFAEAWHLRAEAYARAGEPDAAARDLREALRIEPRHWQALASLSVLQEEQGELQAALRSFGAALAIHPRMPGGQDRLRELRRKAEGDAT
jgi:Tfp pilus assembly protein PilF